MSPSWEDLDTECSMSDRGSVDAVNDSKTLAKNRKNCQINQKKLRQLIERKSRFFKPRQRAFTCTLCGFRCLKNYVMARNHYREKHGRDVSMCKQCDRFFTNSVAYINHMIKRHPRMSTSSRHLAENSKSRESIISGDFPAKNLVPISHSHQNGHHAPTTKVCYRIELVEPSALLHDADGAVGSDNIGNDSILIGEMTDYPSKLYRFPPDTKKCPKSHCYQRFKDRQSMINHYCIKHAKYDILCPECDKLITVSSSHYLKNHFNRKHPNCALPAKKTELTTQLTDASNSCENQLDATIQNDSSADPAAGLHLNASYSRSSTIISRVILKRKRPDLISTVNDGFLDRFDGTSTSVPPKTNVTRPSRKKSNDKLERPTLANKRSCRSRSTGSRHKACSICGIVLSNYVDACDHYHRNHGRNVLMCPYCEIYFLQSTLLTKHVLAEHSRDEVCVEMIAKNGANKSKNDTSNEREIQDGTIGANLDASEDMVHELLQPADVAQERAPTIEHPTTTIDEPLNLTVRKQYEIIDLTISGVLDLSIRK